MHKFAILFATSAFTVCSLAQEPQEPKTVLHASTELVSVDVVVQDAYGKPVHGLKKEDFQIIENKTPQTVRNFESFSFGAPLDSNASAPQVNLSAGMFTNYTPVRKDAPLTVILLDFLNTPVMDQSYAEMQLAEYLKHAPTNSQVAIFGLNSHLVLLQGFTTDQRLLMLALGQKRQSRTSPLLGNGGLNGSGSVSSQTAEDAAGALPSALAAGIVANLRQLEAQNSSQLEKFRMQYTLDAFNQIGRYLGTFTGRKNLIWFSASFPLSVQPSATEGLSNPFAVIQDVEDEYLDTANLLRRAQVAVYPVDARGLIALPVPDIPVNTPSTGRVIQQAFNGPDRKINDEHYTMEQMAGDTGGRAFFNTNDLTGAVHEALEEGANYYTLVYNPTDKNWDNRYRKIKVVLTGPLASQSLRLTYRRGYYAVSAQNRNKSTDEKEAINAQRWHQGQWRAALDFGSPGNNELLFKARVLPASNKAEDTLPQGNIAFTEKFKAPYRRYQVDCVALPGQFDWQPGADGKTVAAVEFELMIYDSEGQLLNSFNKKVRLGATPDAYKQLLKLGLQEHLDISAPAKGNSYLRIGLHDLTSNKIGSFEVPLATVSHLEPAALQSSVPEHSSATKQ